MPTVIINTINEKAKLEGSDKKIIEEDDYDAPAIDEVDNVHENEEPITDLEDDNQLNDESMNDNGISSDDQAMGAVNNINNIDEVSQRENINEDNYANSAPSTEEPANAQEEVHVERRYPERNRISTKSYYELGGFATNFITTTNMSISKATRLYGSDAYLGIYKEVKQLIDKEVFKPIKNSEKKLPCKLFLKQKADKIKGRLVARGHRQDRSTYSQEDTYAATVATHHLFCIASIAAAERRAVVTIDIVGAYLNAKMKRDDIYLHINPELAS
jgi:hypothetical protein